MAGRSVRRKLDQRKKNQRSAITVKDGTTIYYKDWGNGPIVTFSHGWPLSSDAWDGQMLCFAQNGFRVVAHDRRGHGRSSQASFGNDRDGYDDDLASVIKALDLKASPWWALHGRRRSGALAERGLNIVRWTVMSWGGHFAGMEQPELLTKDLREFFRGWR